MDEEYIYAKWLISKAISDGDCVICHLAPVQRGYCYVQVGGRSGVKWRVHRLIWHSFNGPIPEGKLILHKCDNRRCIKLEHLFLGTEQDNTQDMISKGRHRYVLPNNQKVNPDDIRNLYEQGFNRFAIAARLGVSPSTVWNYLRGPYSIAISTGD